MIKAVPVLAAKVKHGSPEEHVTSESPESRKFKRAGPDRESDRRRKIPVGALPIMSTSPGERPRSAAFFPEGGVDVHGVHDRLPAVNASQLAYARVGDDYGSGYQAGTEGGIRIVTDRIGYQTINRQPE